MSSIPLVILAAGRARRFGGVKPLAPIGPNHEAVIDLLASDAVSAGFSPIVIVVNPDSGPQIREHVATVWPDDVEVRFAVQERPFGTVHAVLAARDQVDPTRPFAVANADDLYGAAALGDAARHLTEEGTNVLVGFLLRNALVGSDPVTRGVCEITDGRLAAISERRQVVAASDGSFESGDGLEPVALDPDSVVSMNLWGFAPEMWAVFSAAMEAASNASEDAEVLLPEIVSQLVDGDLPVDVKSLRKFTVTVTTSRCIGITHPGDLDVVRAELVREVERGERPQELFTLRTPRDP